MADAALAGETFYLDAFAIRQWDDPKYSGTRISFDKAEFVRRVHEYHSQGAELVDGYAPFCKHVFVPNFVDAKAGNVEITDDIKGLIETAYESRRPEELAVLSRCATLRGVVLTQHELGGRSVSGLTCVALGIATSCALQRHLDVWATACRWVPASRVSVPQAKMLDVILYSREQIVKEREAMPEKGSASDLPDAPWGIISIKAQDEEHETPMQPITMMRNALGRDEGGSGVTLEKAKYDASVEYWRNRVPVLDR